MAKERMSAKEVRQTARSLEKSLDSAYKGLVTLLKSLEMSGFREAVSSYQQMQLVLIQQRLWARAYNRTELNSRWRKIAEIAESIEEILGPFGAIMAKLKEIDRIEAVDESASAEVPSLLEANRPAVPDKPITEFVQLLAETLWISHTKLERSVSGLTEEQKVYLQQLLEAGLVKRRGWGRSRSYRLAQKPQQEIINALANVLHVDNRHIE